MTLSIFVRIISIFVNPSSDTMLYYLLWSYRFFPFEIALFLSGALAYRMFVQLPSKVLALISEPQAYFLVVLGMIGYLCYFRLLLPRLGEAAYWLYYAMTFIAIPVLFLHTKTSMKDRYIGELSYPMYISHIPILWVVAIFYKNDNIIYIVIPVTILISIILSSLQEHVDNYRHALIKLSQSKNNNGKDYIKNIKLERQYEL